ncbi:MAG: RlmE family RNA methyltransferase [Proteobacteria bacterium]|nr:RlmE family RNA methyltransferase [Pseudomonadota bacterium]
MAKTSDPKSRSRGKKVNVKTARGRKISSTRWLRRQLNDPYVAEARRLGYRTRAAFKLIEIDEKYHLFKGAGIIVDLGAAPGGWCQVLRQIAPGARIIAVDLQKMEPIAGVDFIAGDLLDDQVRKTILEKCAGGADAVISDMASAATGHRATDHIRTMALAEAGLDFAIEVLKPGGLFLTKVLRGGSEGELLDAMKQNFDKVRHIKPPSSRSDSRELFVLATGYRGK